ncbi:flagellin [Anoxybacillus flavithermus]|uniref:Flagellin n=1 Tax=Anoxybacillus flavithermus AK1 TaxID=1297581 RepID=M8CWK0_9BACL|nr:flagellin [Anoxybacillus flavithermus]EMT45893.1 flagellin protein [Anoxybacillus flavithermus AK1]
MRINHNIQALNAYRNLAVNQSNTAKNLEKLSSGLRINRAADDAAGLAISEKMRSQIRGLEVAERNALDAISLIQTAEGALNSVHSMLQRMRELAVQASNDTNTAEDRAALDQEIQQLKTEITRVATSTDFNTERLLDGSKSTTTLGTSPGQVTVGGLTFLFSPTSALNGYTIKLGVVADGTSEGATVDTTNKKIILNGDFDNTDSSGSFANASNVKSAIENALNNAGFSGITVTVSGSASTATSGDESGPLSGGTDPGKAILFQIGANEGQTVSIELGNMTTTGLGIDSVTVTSHNDAQSAISAIDEAIRKVSEERGKLGAIQNRLEHTINNLKTAHENLTSAESRIRDTDMAMEMTNFTKNNILNQAAQAMLAQSNQLPQGILQLLKS